MSKTSAAPAKASEIAIFGRLLRNSKRRMSPPLARYVLTLGFNSEDQARMMDLAAQNQQGALSEEDQNELTGYVKAGHLLALLHSHARQSLKQKKVS